MGTIQVPGRISGRTYTIGIKGDTPSETEQARIRSFLEERESQFAADYEARYGAPRAVDDGTALGRGWELGKAGAYSRLGTATEYLGRGLGLESLVGTGQRMRQEGDYEAFLESLRQPAPTTLQDVTGLGSALTYLGEGIGQSGPEMLAPLAATAAGTLVGGPVAGLGAGAATAFPSFFGGNIQRQEAEVAAGRKEEVDVTNAILGAVGQSALNSIGDKLLLGGFLKPGQKWLTRTAVGAAEGAAVEIPTEIAQTIIERKQAGLPLDNDEAINEYINAGILGGVMGGGIRAGTAGLGIGMERPAAPPAAPPGLPAPSLGLPSPAKPGVAKVSSVGKGVSPTGATVTQIELSDGAVLTIEGDAAEADIARAVDQHNQTKAAAAPKAAPKAAPPAKIGEPPAAEPDMSRPAGGVSIDDDLAEARGIYDERLALAEEGGADPEEAKRIAAQAAVNYVDSLQADTQKRLARFRNTMAHMASPTRGVMPPDLPDSAYAQEFGEAVQQDLFEAPTPSKAKRPVDDSIFDEAWAARMAENQTPPAAPKGVDVGGVDEAISQGVGNINVLENGQPVPFEKFAVSVDGDKAEVGFVERAKGARKGIGYDAYVALGEKLAQRGVRLQSSQTKLGPGQNLWKKLEQNGYAKLNPQTKRLEFVTQAERDAAPAQEVQDDTTTAEAQPEPMGVGVQDGGRGVEPSGQPADDAQPTEGAAAPEEGGLGSDLSVPMGADTAAGAEPDTLGRLEEQLAAARARAAELRKKVPAGILQRELVGGKIDPRLSKQVTDLQNQLTQQQKAAETARAAVPEKPTHPTRPKKLAQYEAALAKANETKAQLAAAQDALGSAELAAGLQRAAVPRTPLTDNNKGAYTAYFNALQDADTLRQTLESERARVATGEPEPTPLPTDLREPVIPDTFLTYQRGITSKPVRPSEAPKAVADAVAKDRMVQRLTQFFQQRATPALLRYTTAQGGINSPTTWKDYPDWMPLADQSKVVQLLGRLNRKEREKYKFPASEVEPLSPDAEAAHTYFSKTIRPVDAIDMMLDDLSADYAIYEGSLRPGLTEIEHRDLMMGTGSEVATRALNWVRANLSPDTNAQIDLLLKKQADANAVTADWIGAEGTDRVAAGRTKRKEERNERARAAEESGYDAATIVSKMAAGDSRVALDQEMHYSVKAALNAGDLKGALRALADTTGNAELKDLANRFAGLVGTTRVRILYPGDPAKYIGNDRGVYVQARAGVDPDYENTILINGQTGMTNHVLMHEMAHAVSAKFIHANPNHPVVRQLESLLSELRARGPKQDWLTDGRVAVFTYPNEFYGLKNVSEMVAEGYGRLAFGETDNGLRDLMKRTLLPGLVDKQVEFENPLTAWERFKEIIGNILNAAMRRPLTRRPRTKRIETIQVYETAADRFHRLVDGLLSEAPQVLPDSVLQKAVVNPMVAKNVLNNAVLNAPVWNAQGRARLADLLSSAVPGGLRGALLGLLQLDWFNDLAGKYFPQIAELKKLDDLRRGKVSTMNSSVKPVLEDLLAYAKKSPELYAKLSAIQGQATLAGVDPTEPQSKYAGDKEKSDIWLDLNRQLTTADSTGEMRALFRKLRNVMRSYRTEVERVLRVKAEEITGDKSKADTLVRMLLKKLDEENAIDPYFSLMRKGDFWLEYTAEDTTGAPVSVDPLGKPQRPTVRFVQAFESPFARANFRAQLEAKGLAWDFEENTKPITDRANGGYIPPEFAQAGLNIINSFDRPGASPEEQAKVAEAKTALEDLFLRLTPDHSFLKSFLKRKGTRGFVGDITPLGVIDAPIDIVQGLAEKTSALSYQLTNMEYGARIQRLINGATATQKDLAKSTSLTAGEKAAVAAYYAEFVARAKFAKSPQVSGAAQLARGATFNMTLGFSIAGALNNLMQIPMIGATELGGRYGMSPSMRELGFAMRALRNAGKTQRVLSYGPDGREVRDLDNVDNFGSIANYFEPDENGKLRLRTDIKIPAKLRDKIADLDVLAEVLQNNGMLTASMSQEMLEAETGWLHKINRWGGFLMHHAERFNRQSMAIAAYNLELGKISGQASPEAKLAAAMKAVEIAERVNGTIGAATAPRLAQSAVGSVVFMFKRFGLHMARYIIGTANQALRGASPEDRAVARYQIIGMLGTTALFAGVQGLPFFSELMTLFSVFFTDDDEERPEVVVQKFLGEPYYHGALNYMLGIEIASRISMSGLIFRENKIEKDQSVLYDLFEMFGGPAVGVFMNTERGITLLSEGEFYRGVEAMSPSVIKSILKAGRFGTEGATTLRGDEIIPLTPADVIKQALGYTPEAYARQQERVSGAKRIDEAIRNRKRRLLKRYNMAIADGDFADARDILKEMREFSREHPEDAITSDTINRSSRSFRQRSQEMISGVTFTTSGRPRAQQYIDEFDQDTSFWGS